MAIIYHVTSLPEWEAAVASGSYTAPSLQLEGFIHCSTEEQVAGVLQRYFKGRTNLVRLFIDTEHLVAPLVFEQAPSVQEDFPHIYGPLNTDAVVAIEKIEAPES